MGNRIEIAEALAVTAELTATDLSQTAMSVMVDDLAAYETGMVLKALNRCRRELTGRLTLAAVLARLDTGLPSADEAFGMLVEGLQNEALTVVVPVIAMQAAGNGAWDLYRAGDKTGARMAFREAYERLAADVAGAPEWTVSAGHDREHRAAAVMEAVKLGRLPEAVAAGYLPSEAGEARHLLLTGRALTDEQRRIGRERVAGIMALLQNKMTAGEA